MGCYQDSVELRNPQDTHFPSSCLYLHSQARSSVLPRYHINEFFILKWGRGESYSEMTDVFPQTNISQGKERLFIQANWNLRGMGGLKPKTLCVVSMEHNN